MRPRFPAAMLVAALGLAACGGGGGGGTAPQGAPVLPLATAAPTAAPLPQGSIPMAISIPRKAPSGAVRSPRFVSPGVGAVAIYDGTTLLYVANLELDSTPPFTTIYAKSGTTSVAFGTCTFTNAAATCMLTITSTIGAHKFDIVMYPNGQGAPTATPPAFTGVISSEGELSVTLTAGANPGATMTLLGVADTVIYAGQSEAAYNTAVTYGYRIGDSTNTQIVQPGNAFDNGPVTITAAPPGIVTITPNSIAVPPVRPPSDQNFAVTCVNAAGGTVTISIGAQTSPTTAYASGLTYSTANYAPATLVTIPFVCDPDTATIPITVQGKRK